ncbi:MAG: hypothetical protein A2901_04140 [Elusimicrobia bacterium RIFCSPLOWO2_01_FULL_54_10]|nr:MAG: hypothetical protein A2901_04140 [Elusimicrobia bacterium RIFCSPLOWO2_01_FULL_54_10]
MKPQISLIFLTAGILAVVGGLAASPRGTPETGSLLSETALLLNQSDGLLTDPQAQEVIRNSKNLIVKRHEVKSNEWLEKVAKNYGTYGHFLRSTNNLEDPVLRTRQLMIVYNKKGMVHIAQGGEPIEQIIKTYERLGGRKKNILAQNAWDEIAQVHNGTLILKEGAKLWIPSAQKSFPVLFRPVAWSRISSGFGFRRHPVHKYKRFHDGFDMVAPHGSAVRASESGVVTFAGWQGGYGNMVEIRHKNTTTRYGHLSKIEVQVGDRVDRKHLIGRVGSTGISTGPHLHFEVRRNSDGKLQNPRKYLF